MRGRLIGERLLRATALSLESSGKGNGLHVWVFEANEAARRFYHRLGGEVVGRDLSGIPAAAGSPILQVYWPKADSVRRR